MSSLPSHCERGRPLITNKAGSRVKEARDRTAQQPPFRENCEGSKRGDDLPVALSITHSLHSYIHTFTHPCISRPLLLRRSTPILTTLVIAVLTANDRPGCTKNGGGKKPICLLRRNLRPAAQLSRRGIDHPLPPHNKTIHWGGRRIDTWSACPGSPSMKT